MSNQETFIETIAPIVQKYAKEYGIKVASPIIAQACLESGYGTGYKAQHHNYFGLKYRANRCPSSNGTFIDTSSEQNADGSYKTITDEWFAFPNMDAGVKGYFEFTSISTYANLKTATSPRQYLEYIKADKYATSLDYVDKVMNVVNKCELTKYDTIETSNETGGRKMVINVHAGHNPDGKVACGAIGLIKESTEARNVKNEVIRQLTLMGHTVYDCTVDNGTSQADVLSKIVAKCNAHNADLDVSIHFNSGAKDTGGNGKTTGTEVFVYSSSSAAKGTAQSIVNAIAELGFKNRGVKINSSLYVLRKTTAPACLVECCFVDDKDDVQLYNVAAMATAIVKGITGETLVEKSETIDKEAEAKEAETPTGDPKVLYRVQVGAYSKKENAEAMQKQLKADGYNSFITQ